MPVNDPKDLRPPVKYKPRPVARQLSRAEIKQRQIELRRARYVLRLR